MKVFKKLIAVVCALTLVATLTACHKKDEVALTIDGVNITSALYLNALLESDMEARSKVDEQLASSEESEQTAEVDYFAQKIDGKNFETYVKSEAINRCRQYAFYQKLIDAKTITLTDDEIAEAKSYADMYWSYYGYNTVFEANGISLDTYKKAFVYTYYANENFMRIYGKDGEKAVDAETIKKTMGEKYILVHTLTKTYDENAKDEDKAAARDSYQKYITRLEKGEDFKTIYEELNPTEKDETEIDLSELEDTSSSDAQTDGPEGDKPLDEYATIIGDEDTNNYASDDFKTVDAMKVGEVKLVENSDKTGFTVYQKLDINADPYYLKTLNDAILVVLKQEEYDKMVEEEAAKLTVEEHKFALNRFKVKNIKYPTAQ